MSIRIMSEILGMPLPEDVKLPLVILGDYANDEGGDIFPSMATLGFKLGSTGDEETQRKKGQRRMQKLLKAGFVELEEGGQGGRSKTSRYRLKMDAIRDSIASHFINRDISENRDTALSENRDTQESHDPSVPVREEEQEEELFPPTPQTRPAYGVSDLVRAYNEIVATHCPNVGKINVVSDKLREKVRLRLREHPEKEFWEDRERGVLWLIRYNTFLRGDVKDWHVTPSWLFKNSDNCSKIVNGDYAKNHRPPAVRRPEPQPETPMMSEEERQRSLAKFREKAQEAGLA